MNNNITAYAALHKDNALRISSTSGGAFPALAKRITDNGGYVFGVKYDENFNPVFDCAETYEECKKFVGSKYSQADPKDSFRQVRELLRQDKTVLFVGTPCQVYGLKCFLGNMQDSAGLYCVDLICMGVAAPLVWNNYLKENFRNDKISSIFLKNKEYGWHRFSVSVKTDKQNYLRTGDKDLFMSAYVNGTLMRPSCYSCPFKKLERKADITIGDCWGIESIMPEIDDNKGVSLFINYTGKGEKLVASLTDMMDMYPVEFEKAISGNRYYSIPKEKPDNRDKYMKYQLSDYRKCFRKNNPDTFMYKVKRKLKNITR